LQNEYLFLKANVHISTTLATKIKEAPSVLQAYVFANASKIFKWLSLICNQPLYWYG